MPLTPSGDSLLRVTFFRELSPEVKPTMLAL